MSACAQPKPSSLYSRNSLSPPCIRARHCDPYCLSLRAFAQRSALHICALPVVHTVRCWAHSPWMPIERNSSGCLCQFRIILILSQICQDWGFPLSQKKPQRKTKVFSKCDIRVVSCFGNCCWIYVERSYLALLLVDSVTDCVKLSGVFRLVLCLALRLRHRVVHSFIFSLAHILVPGQL